MEMARRTTLTLGLVFVLWLGITASADAHRGWRGGWGWAGGRWGGYHVGFGHRHWHGYNHGWWGGSRFGISIGIGGYGSPWGWGYGYRPYSYGYAYRPLYSGWAYDAWPSLAYSYYTPPVAYSYYAPPVVIDARPPVIIGSAAPTIVQSTMAGDAERLPAPTREDIKPARIEVVVSDPQADVWFANYQTRSKGLKRVFETPALQPGRPYSYPVTVQWTENGVVKRENRKVSVSSGVTVVADFSADQVPPVPAGERQPLSMVQPRR